MKIQPYVQKLENSPVYKDFQGKNKDAFLVAGFFVIDFESGNNIHQIDFFVPSKKKFAAFTLDNKVMMQLFDTIDKRMPEVLDMKVNIDLEALQGILQDEMKNRGITGEIKKMIAVVQNIKGKKIWNVNCVLSGMDILRAHIEDESETVLRLEKASIMNYVKKLPGLGGKPAQAPKESTKEEIEEKIKQLDKIKEALKQEEVEIEKKQKSAEIPSVKASAKKRR